MSRHRLYEIIEVSDEDSKNSNVYNTIMFVSIIVSIIPLTFKEPLLFLPLQNGEKLIILTDTKLLAIMT